MITLTITVDDNEFAGLLADAIARGSLAGAGMVAPPAVQQDTGPADPWADEAAGWPQGTQAAPGATQAAPQTYPAAGAQVPLQPVSQSVPPVNFQPGTSTAQNPGYVQNAAPQSQPPASSAQNVVPVCQHGPMKFVPGGFSKKTGRPYPAFWACQAQRGTPQCKGQEA